MTKKLNGYIKLIVAIIAVLTLLYNTVATHVILKNDVKHLDKRTERMENKVDKLYEFMIKP